MAARNPTDFNRWIDEGYFIGLEDILESEIDKVYNDQVMVLDAEQLAISDCWFRATINSTSAFPATAGTTATQLIRQWYGKWKDMCDVAGVVTNDGIPFAIRVLAWVTGGATAEIRGTTGASTNETQTASFTSSTPTWQTIDDINFRTNDTEESLILEGRISSGAGNLYVAGLGVFAKET